jgi:hypothetical protein
MMVIPAVTYNTFNMGSLGFAVEPTSAKGIARQWPVPACAVGAPDLRRLFELLNAKASEAAAEQVRQVQRSQAQTDEQFTALQREVYTLMALVVRIQAAGGEWIVANSADAMSEDSLPAVIRSVSFECGQMYRARFNLFPQNQFSVNVDFTRTPIMDLTNLALANTFGPSVVNISGVNSTWVNAVDHELHSFFQDRRIRRGWLHSNFAYDVALFLVGVPVTLDLIYNIDKRFGPMVKLPPAVFVALYVYLVLLILFAFRILFNYAKWVFPKIDGPSRRGSALAHKVVLTAVFVTLTGRVVTTLLWLTGIHLH